MFKKALLLLLLCTSANAKVQYLYDRKPDKTQYLSGFCMSDFEKKTITKNNIEIDLNVMMRFCGEQRYEPSGKPVIEHGVIFKINSLLPLEIRNNELTITNVKNNASNTIKWDAKRDSTYLYVVPQIYLEQMKNGTPVQISAVVEGETFILGKTKSDREEMLLIASLAILEK